MPQGQLLGLLMGANAETLLKHNITRQTLTLQDKRKYDLNSQLKVYGKGSEGILVLTGIFEGNGQCTVSTHGVSCDAYPTQLHSYLLRW